jgi:hypothetical protein
VVDAVCFASDDVQGTRSADTINCSAANARSSDDQEQPSPADGAGQVHASAADTITYKDAVPCIGGLSVVDAVCFASDDVQGTRSADAINCSAAIARSSDDQEQPPPAGGAGQEHAAAEDTVTYEEAFSRFGGQAAAAARSGGQGPASDIPAARRWADMDDSDFGGLWGLQGASPAATGSEGGGQVQADPTRDSISYTGAIDGGSASERERARESVPIWLRVGRTSGSCRSAFSARARRSAP